MTTHIKDSILILPLEENVLFPGIITKIKVNSSVGNAIHSQIKEGFRRMVALTIDPTRNHRDSADEKKEDSFYPVGLVGELLSHHVANDGFLVDFRTMDRVKIETVVYKDQNFYVPINEMKTLEIQDDLDTKSHQKMLEFTKETIKKMSENFRGSDAFVNPILMMNSMNQIIAAMMPLLPISTAEKQELLEFDSYREKALHFIDILISQEKSVELQLEIVKKSSEQTNKSYRDHILRQQLKTIQEELGENEGETGKKSYRERLEEENLPEEVYNIALHEVIKLEASEKGNPEGSIIRNYLDLIFDLSWRSTTPSPVDLNRARAILAGNHYGLTEVKERIIQHLAVMKLRREKQGSILLLVGPPGTGKTSLGKSIAQALERAYFRASLGGVRDEAEIRGHRRTYVGALPGRIIAGMRKVGSHNPVFVLDEIDKISSSFAGDPTSALLEVLDPEQNNTFADHYLEIPFDLSDIFFIATANSLDAIPSALLDRTEIIEVNGYTDHEKLQIAQQHMLEKVLKEHGLDESQLLIKEEVLKVVIEKYTREAGVRGLGKQLAKIARSVSETIISGEIELPFIVGIDRIENLLGHPKIRLDSIGKDNVPGVATGLAWTPFGGDILFVEARTMPGNGRLTLTGQLGDVMKESANIALSLVRSRLGHLAGSFDFLKNDVHVHFPAGAIQKDGPSAGSTITVALASLLLGKKISPSTAITGEITLRGAILPVGGIKEKTIAAHRAGAKKIILPMDNESDIKDIPEDVRKGLQFLPIKTIEELFKETLNINLTPLEALLDGGKISDKKKVKLHLKSSA